MYIDSSNVMEPDGDQPVAQELREAFEELLRDFRVDLTLHGHHHSYQRTCAAFRGECVGNDDDGVPLAPPHFVIGNAGAGLCQVERHAPSVRQPCLAAGCLLASALGDLITLPGLRRTRRGVTVAQA